MGCSKKTCYLCGKLLSGHGAFRTRGSHGKVYHRWSVPAMADVLFESVLIIKADIMQIEDDMTVRFEKSMKTPNLVEVAESSAGLSPHSQSSLSV